MIIFAWHLAQCCPYYRDVRYSGVSARRELTVIVACTLNLSLNNTVTVEQHPAPLRRVVSLVSSRNTPSRPLVGWWGGALRGNTKDG